MKANTDQYFIEQVLSGNHQAYGILVDRYQDYVFTVVIRILKVREEAEEVAQDVFIKAFKALKSYRGEAKFSTWLYRIAYHKALDRIKKNNRQVATLGLIEEISEVSVESVKNGMEQMLSEERSAMIQKALMQLPETDAAIITLYYFDGQSLKDIARITDLTEDNIKIKLYRSRKKLFTLLSGYVMPEIKERDGKAI